MDGLARDEVPGGELPGGELPGDELPGGEQSAQEEAGQLERAGRLEQRQQVNRQAEEATQRKPDDAEAWLWRAATAESPEARMAYLSRALELDPDHPAARRAMYDGLQSQLQQDAFLAYLNETAELYQVETAGELTLLVPKNRAIPEPYPPPPGTVRPLATAYRLLVLATIGLLPAGLGALILAPAAAASALRIWRQPSVGAVRARARVVFCLALAVWLAAVLMVFLLVLHF
jgi:hypothetical protein